MPWTPAIAQGLRQRATADKALTSSDGDTATSALARAPPTAGPQPLGRIPVADMFPSVDGGTRPSKSLVGEEFNITDTVYPGATTW